MVVPLLALPDEAPHMVAVRSQGFVIRLAKSFERQRVAEFVEQHWPDWVDEVKSAFAGAPSRIFVATKEGEPVGFAAYDVDYRGVFGPTGVAPEWQGSGLGAALLLRTLTAMRDQGYLYAIIGAVGPAEFYRRFAGAMSLPTEWPNFTDPDPA